MTLIQPITTLPLSSVQQEATEVDQATSTFGGMLGSMVEDLKQEQQAANQTIEELHGGGEKNLHEAMIAMEKADIALRYVVEVRNKALDAYQEISSLQL